MLPDGLRWTVTDGAAKREILDAGMGWDGMGWDGLPEHVVRAALHEGTLRELDIAEFRVKAIELFTLRRSDRPGGPVARALWARIGDTRRRPG